MNVLWEVYVIVTNDRHIHTCISPYSKGSTVTLASGLPRNKEYPNTPIHCISSIFNDAFTIERHNSIQPPGYHMAKDILAEK